MSFKKIISALTVAAMLFSCCSCGNESDDSSEKTVDYDVQSVQEAIAAYPASAVKGTEEQADTVIILDNDNTNIQGDGASYSNGVVKITKAGKYLVYGTLSGSITVDTNDDDKVKLMLCGAYISCSDGPAVYVASSPKKTVLYSCEGSVNILSDGSSYSDTDDDAPTAAVYSCDDLKFNGSGEIYIAGNYNKGVFSKDDIEVESGSVTVACYGDGVRGKDSVTVCGGTVNICCGGDGLRSTRDDDSEKGYVAIEDGSVTINSQLDAVQAQTDVTISGGTLSITTGGGSENSSTGETADQWGDWGSGGKGMHGGDKMMFGESTQEETDSAKGIKAENAVNISGGTISVNSSDDSVHSNNTVTISNAVISAQSGDDGIHADSTLNINSGSITVSKSYEGLEAEVINIYGGDIDIVASDDGLNAAGGADNSAMGRPGANGFSGSSDALINITGGEISVNASGDGVDSNNNITMSGGTLTVFGPTNDGNGSLDYENSFTLTGGTVLAAGSSGMAQSISASGQGVLGFTCSVSQNTEMVIKQGDTVVVSFTSPKQYSCVVYTSSKVKTGESYDVYVNGEQLSTLTAK